MKSIKATAVLLIALLSVTACTTITTHRPLYDIEKRLATHTDNTILYHPVLYYPKEVSLDFPGYIVGIEKSPVDRVTRSGDDVVTVCVPGSRLSAEKAKEKLIDRKIMFVSHVVENFGMPYGLGNCAHYNVYHSETTDTHPTIGFCDTAKPEVFCTGTGDEKHDGCRDAYLKSWKAMDILKEAIADKLSCGAGYTHVLVASMGWNTPQEEAIRNFNSIVSNIKIAAGNTPFNPLFIGVTWPSEWQSPWIDPIFKGLSYTTKADDADEVGLSWLGVLLHDTLAVVPRSIPVVVIGHSFGARATSMGVCMGPAISRDGGLIPRQSIDLLISLQGAYSVNRFFENKGADGFDYPEQCASAGSIVLTASRFDTAMDTGFWAQMAGNDRTFNRYCADTPHEGFACTLAIACGSIAMDSAATQRITYVNADALIRHNAYATGGDAHSDIYRREMGRMLWEVISAKASTKHPQ